MSQSNTYLLRVKSYNMDIFTPPDPHLYLQLPALNWFPTVRLVLRKRHFILGEKSDDNDSDCVDDTNDKQINMYKFKKSSKKHIISQWSLIDSSRARGGVSSWWNG